MGRVTGPVVVLKYRKETRSNFVLQNRKSKIVDKIFRVSVSCFFLFALNRRKRKRVLNSLEIIDFSNRALILCSILFWCFCFSLIVPVLLIVHDFTCTRASDCVADFHALICGIAIHPWLRGRTRWRMPIPSMCISSEPIWTTMDG